MTRNIKLSKKLLINSNSNPDINISVRPKSSKKTKFLGYNDIESELSNKMDAPESNYSTRSGQKSLITSSLKRNLISAQIDAKKIKSIKKDISGF